ncbi:MAG: hypothetical protein KJ571_11115 [Bacteroidetes bacterium]|nr:hypothetical protein [Bacteroidota bacterium]
MKILGKILLMFFILQLSVQAQYSDPALRSIGYHTGNRAGISYYNDGQIAGFSVGIDIRGEWPLGSGENYIGDCIPLIGVEFVNDLGDTLQSVVISRGPRNGQFNERHPTKNYFWGWNPTPGFRNPNYQSVAMSHLPDSWPIQGWNDPVANSWKDEFGKTQWFGFFGRGIMNADQESFFEADDQWDDEFNSHFKPDANDLNRNGMGLRMRQRGFQWSSFLAEDAIFWLYDITNDGTHTYRKANFGTVVGTLAGGDGDSGDDLGTFVIDESITYSYDSDNVGNRGQEVGWVGYAFLESPGNAFDGIDNDNDSQIGTSPRFIQGDFAAKTYKAGDKIVLINESNGNGVNNYNRTVYTVKSTIDTVYSLGKSFIIEPGVTQFREGHIAGYGGVRGEIALPHISANDGYDNDLDGLIDENEAAHYLTRVNRGDLPVSYKNYITNEGLNDPLIDERRDNDIDEDGDWSPIFDDLGEDGLGPEDEAYPGPDLGEGDGIPTQGEPNFGKTDPDESDQIGLTAFNFFANSASPDLSIDSLVWNRMTPGRFDIIPPTPQDGDFIYSSGYFPLFSETTERFSVALLFGEDSRDINNNKDIVQKIYNSGYVFPQAPRKPKITITQEDGNVVLYWDGERSENSRDFVTKEKDFQGYKIFRSTDANFRDSRVITNALGVLSFDKPLAQYDLVDNFSGFYYPSPDLLAAFGGITYYLGENLNGLSTDNGITNVFVDSTVVPGQTYYYAVTAYDKGDEALEIFPEENSKFIFRSNTGAIITDDNTGYITPGRRPAGYISPNAAEMEKSENFIGTGSGFVEIIDDEKIRDGYNYKVVFQDTSLRQVTSNWSLIDLQTPDTLFLPTINETIIVDPLQTVNIPAGITRIFVNGEEKNFSGTTYTASYDTLVNQSDKFRGSTPVRQGIRVQLLNDAISTDSAHTGFTGVEDTLKPQFTQIKVFKGKSAAYDGVGIPNDYKIEFFPNTVGQSVRDTIGFPPVPALNNVIVPRSINFKVTNLTTGVEVDVVYPPPSGSQSTAHNFWLKEHVNGQYIKTWNFIFTYNTVGKSLPSGGSYMYSTFKQFNSKDSFTFTVEGAKIDNDLAKKDLDKIRVVPNPYVVTHDAEQRLLSTQTSGRGEREIRFTYVPPGSKISIYTVRGELIRTLTQDNFYVGDVYWNLRTEENLDVAFGVYVYVVDAPNIGTKIDKFALIK